MGYHQDVKEFIDKQYSATTVMNQQQDETSCGFICLYYALQYLEFENFKIPFKYAHSGFQHLCKDVMVQLDDKEKEIHRKEKKKEEKDIKRARKRKNKEQSSPKNIKRRRRNRTIED